MRFLLFFLLFLGTYYLQAQKMPGLKDQIVDTSAYGAVRHYKTLGLAYKSVRDKALSPLLFQGPGFSLSHSFWKRNKSWLWQNEIGSQFHLLENEPGSSLLLDGGFNYRISALRELSPDPGNKWEFWAGPEANLLINYRIHSRNGNNPVAYEGVISFGGSALLGKEFSLWGRRFAVSNQFHLPLIFLYVRPAYSWAIPPAIYEEQEGAWKEALEVGTLNNIFLFQNQLNFDFLLPKRRKGKLLKYSAYRISYSWHYFQISSLNQMQSGGHQLSFSRIVTF